MERVCGHGFKAVALFFEFRNTFDSVRERRVLTVLFSHDSIRGCENISRLFFPHAFYLAISL